MTHLEVLVRKAFRAVNSCGSCSVPVQEISTLNHELLDHTMELAALVTLRSAQVVLRLSGAVLSKVLGRPRHDVGKQLHLDAAERLTAESDVEKDDRIWLCHFGVPGSVLSAGSTLVSLTGMPAG